MSKPWNPEAETARARPVDGLRAAPPVRRSWPNGATAGLVLVAAGCVGAAVILYQVAGPRDVFAP